MAALSAVTLGEWCTQIMADLAGPETLRNLYRRLLDSASRTLAAAGIHPDWLTMASLPPAVLAGIAAAFGAFTIAAVLFAISGILDLLDGALARHTGRATRFGALLDSTLDRLADAAVPAGLVVFYAPHGALAALPVLTIIAGFLISYIRARAEGLDIALPRLWMRREDRFLAMTAGLLLAPLAAPALGVPAPVLLAVMAALAGLGFVAAFQALRAAAKRS